ncbi:MAG: hypothetical protein K8S20_16370 [Chloroflexi bacterium]|nr:hypothetical protein [Chloroflexota bacterium]
MTATPALARTHKKNKGSLTGTLVSMLLFFIPLASMAGAAYIRAQSPAKEPAITESKDLLTKQLKIIKHEIDEKVGRNGTS